MLLGFRGRPRIPSPGSLPSPGSVDSGALGGTLNRDPGSFWGVL